MSCFDNHHYLDPLSAEQRANNLLDALAESVFLLTDDEVRAELEEDGRGPDEVAAELDLMFQQALLKAVRS